MALQAVVVARATEPHMVSLATALQPLLSVANAGSFHLRWTGSAVVIEQASFTGVNQTSVDSAVAAAPQRTAKLDAKSVIDTWPLELLAAFDSVRDAINIERARHGAAAVTRATFLDTIKTKVDSWS